MTLMKSSFQKGRDSKTGRHNYHVYQIFIGPSKLVHFRTLNEKVGSDSWPFSARLK